MGKAPRNRTLTLSDAERRDSARRLLRPPAGGAQIAAPWNRTLLGDALEILPRLPRRSVDLVIADPPYNLSKDFGGSTRFKARTDQAYAEWLDAWMKELVPLLKPTASVYVCGDWRSSGAIQQVGSRYFQVRNRITWEREKGRGALQNWKNCSEDLWFFTVSDRYTFHADAVKLRRKVVAPYRDTAGRPRDWDGGSGTRLTAASNLWTDLTVPFWSMPENTEHPTQKPEKFAAKILLASSNPGDVVLDPFLGSGTTSVTALKLGRRYVGIELDEQWACVAEARLKRAAKDPAIQGYAGGVFWERNSKPRLDSSPARHFP